MSADIGAVCEWYDQKSFSGREINAIGVLLDFMLDNDYRFCLEKYPISNNTYDIRHLEFNLDTLIFEALEKFCSIEEEIFLNEINKVISGGKKNGRTANVCKDNN